LESEKRLLEELSLKYRDLFTLGVVNCEFEEEICQSEFSIYNPPMFVAYTSNIKHDGIKYIEPSLKVNKLANFAAKLLENFVQHINDGNFKEFIENSQE
jgi:DnaJ family protein C protein 16